MKQILRNTGANLEITFYGDEDALSADGTVTVTITRADGTQVSTGNATLISGPAYRYVLAPQSALDHLTITWTGTFTSITQTLVTEVEIVGGFHVALAELRRLRNLDDVTKFTTAELVDARRWFEITAERHCKVAFVPRFERELLDGTGCAELLVSKLLGRTLLAASVDGVAQTVSGWVLHPDKRLVRNTGVFSSSTTGRNVAVAYEHGLDAVPADVKEAAKVAIRARLLNDQAGRPAVPGPAKFSEGNDSGGTTRYVLAGADRPTGIPEVDAVLNAYRDQYAVPGLA